MSLLEEFKSAVQEKHMEQQGILNSYSLKKLNEELEKLEKEETEFWENKRDFENLLLTVIMALIEQPIAADANTFTVEEITQDLQDLKIGYAYVKTASGVFSMQTTNIYTDPNYRAVSIDEAMERRNTIINQTKKKYCRGRAEIDAEIDAVYTPPTEEPPAVDNAPTNLRKDTSIVDKPPVVKPQQQPATLDRYDDLKEFDNIDF